MAVAFAASQIYRSTDGGNSTSGGTLTLPTWTVGGQDYIFIAVVSNSTSSNVSTPSGYSILLGPTQSATSTAPSLIVFYKTAVGGDSGASLTLSVSPASSWTAVCRVYSGVVSIDASAIAGNGSQTTTLPTPSLTLTVSGDTEVGFWGYGTSNGSFSWTPPSGWGNDASGTEIFSPFTGFVTEDVVASGTIDNTSGPGITNGPANSVTAKIALAPTAPAAPRSQKRPFVVGRQALVRASVR